MDWLQAVFLGVLQGLTEFLPISSSAHLRIFPDLFGWGDPGAPFTAVVQIGTEAAVLLFFRREIWTIGTGWARSLVKPELRGHRDALMGWYVIIGSVPIVLLGIVFKGEIEEDLRSLWIIGSTLIGLGIVLGVAEVVGARTRPLETLGWRSAVLLGLAQACALVPGVSRSGATISMALFLGFQREAATRYAFLLAIPAVVGAGVFELRSAVGADNLYSPGQTAAATVVAFLVGYASIAWLLRYITTHSFAPFVAYRILLGGAVLLLVATGVLAA